MSDKSLADLAEEYEENAAILERQIAGIDEQIKSCKQDGMLALLDRRNKLRHILFEVRLTAKKLRHYYDK